MGCVQCMGGAIYKESVDLSLKHSENLIKIIFLKRRSKIRNLHNSKGLGGNIPNFDNDNFR